MTEIELVDLGFKRVEISPEESGDGKGFYYYTYDLSENDYTFALMSNENDNTINGKWWVKFMEVDDYTYFDKNVVSSIINSIKGKIDEG